MTSTFTRIAGAAGLLGSILMAALMAAPALFPDSQPFGALIYGSATLLLAVFAAGLYQAGNKRLSIVTKAALAVVIAAFLAIAVLAVLDVFTRLGWGNYEWLWPVLVIAAALAFAGLAVYGAGATIAGAIPGWTGIPLAIGGAGFVTLLIVAIFVGDRPAGAGGQAIDMVAIASMAVIAAALSVLGLMLALGRIPGSAAPPRALPRPST